MRWSCPHCGTQLALAEEKFGSGWSFARCYRCGGFALIRRSELSVIRVDKAPAGENVLLPEATPSSPTSPTSEDPRRALSAAAAQNYTRAITPPTPSTHSGTNAGAPGNRTAAPLPIPPRPAIRPAPLRNSAQSTTIQVAPPTHVVVPPEPTLRASLLPDPLPEISLLSASPLPDILRTSKRPMSTNLLYGGIALASIATLSSGIYLFSEGRSLIERNAHSAHSRSVANEDEARRDAQPAPRAPSHPDDDAIPAAPTFAQAATGNVAALGNSGGEVTDQLHHMAMAPNRALSPPMEAAAALSVRATRPGIHLYSGPGMQFPVVGTADTTLAYPVKGWSEQWFKVALGDRGVEAWVRNDLVTPTSH